MIEKEYNRTRASNTERKCTTKFFNRETSTIIFDSLYVLPDLLDVEIDEIIREYGNIEKFALEEKIKEKEELLETARHLD